MQISILTICLISSLFIVIEAAQPRVPHLKGELNSTGAENHEDEHENNPEYDPHRRHPHVSVKDISILFQRIINLPEKRLPKKKERVDSSAITSRLDIFLSL